jgi:hypothetical protein
VASTRKSGWLGKRVRGHTHNPRLSDADITYIADHGQVNRLSFSRSSLGIY